MLKQRCAAAVFAALTVAVATSIGANAAFAVNPHRPMPTASAELTSSQTCRLSAVVQWTNFPDNVNLVAVQLTSRGGGRPTQLEDQSSTNVTGMSGTVTIPFNLVGTPGSTYYVDAQVNSPTAHTTAKSKAITLSCTPA